MSNAYFLYKNAPVRVRAGSAEIWHDGYWYQVDAADVPGALPVSAAQFDEIVKKRYGEYAKKENNWNPALHPRGQPENAGEFVERPGASSPREPRDTTRPKQSAGHTGHGGGGRTEEETATAAHRGDHATETPPPPREQRSNRAARLAFFRSPAWRRVVEHALKNEGEVADGIGGHNLPDSEPADVVYSQPADGQPITDHSAVRDFLREREKAVQTLRKRGASSEEQAAAQRVLAQPCVFLEVKTLLTQAAGAIHMSAPAVARKKRWEKRYRVQFYTVALDDRRGEKHSGHRLYFRAGVGSVKLSEMERVNNFEALLEEIRA